MRILFYVMLVLSAHSSVQAFTKESAVQRCEGAIELIKQAPIDIQDPQIKYTLDTIVSRMRDARDSLKKTKDVQDIYDKRNVCDMGFKVVRFLMEHFSNTPPHSLEPVPDIPLEGHAQKDQTAQIAPETIAQHGGQEDEDSQPSADASPTDHARQEVPNTQGAEAPSSQKSENSPPSATSQKG